MRVSCAIDLHPHRDMETISIILKGQLRHFDNQQNSEVISKGMIQTMTAGTGVLHGEYNASDKEEVQFLQVWIFPNRKNLEPGYQIRDFGFHKVQNDHMTLVSPNKQDHALSINQSAWVTHGSFTKDETAVYTLHAPKENGAYLFILNGQVHIDDDRLNARDGAGIEGAEDIPMIFDDHTTYIILEVPMH